MYKLEELKKLEKKKLLEEIKKAEKELFKDGFEVKTGQPKASHKLRINKRYIAQMKTLLNS